MNKFGVVALAAALSLTAGLTFAQNTGAKEDIKEAGRSTKRAAKKTGSAVKKGTKKAVNKSAEGVEKGANAVKDKTNP